VELLRVLDGIRGARLRCVLFPSLHCPAPNPNWHSWRLAFRPGYGRGVRDCRKRVSSIKVNTKIESTSNLCKVTKIGLVVESGLVYSEEAGREKMGRQIG
jgi:hypothetical protein